MQMYANNRTRSVKRETRGGSAVLIRPRHAAEDEEWTKKEKKETKKRTERDRTCIYIYREYDYRLLT